MKTILIAPQPFIEARGTPMANFRTATALAGAGHSVEVVTYPFGTAPEHPGIRVHRCRRLPLVRGVGIGFSAAKLAMDLSLAFRLRGVIESCSPDCLHGVEEGAIIGALFPELPLIYDMDSVMSHDAASSWAARVPGAVRVLSAAERWAIRRASVVLTISESMAAHVREIDPEKPVVVAPDVPIPDKSAAPANLPAEKRVVYTGSFAAYQGLDLLVRAMEMVPDATLFVVGGDEKGIQRLRKLAVRNVVFLGKKPPEEIPGLLAAADVLVSPRRSGVNPPYKVYTYIQAEKPLVATDIPAHTTVLSKESAILVPPSPEGLAEGISWGLAHRDESMRRAARAREVIARFTPEHQTRQILSAYEIVAKGATK
ncbi:MAG: glycosyltransferase family 4 protein [Armatimonadota bacterium]